MSISLDALGYYYINLFSVEKYFENFSSFREYYIKYSDNVTSLHYSAYPERKEYGTGITCSKLLLSYDISYVK